MLLRYGHDMVTVPLKPGYRRLVLEDYREQRSRFGYSRREARQWASRYAFVLVASEHPDWRERPLASAPDWHRSVA